MYKWESLLVINNEHLSSNSHHLNGGAICPNTIRRKGSNNPGMGSAKSGARRKVSQGYLVFVIKIACPPWISVIGHGIGGKYIPIMARLAEARHWSKRRQTCLSSPDLTAIHNKWWLKDPSTFTPCTTGRSYDILRRVSYES